MQVLLSHAAGYSMAKTLRVAAIALALMLAGVVGLAWFFANTDLDQRRGDLADWLSTETGYEVRIDGKLAVRHALRHALWPHLTVEDLSVWTLTDGERQLLAKVEELTLVVNPFDLLLRGLLIDEVMLRGAEVNLVRDAAGRDSWITERGEDSGEGIDLVVREARVEHSSITFRNALAKAETRLELEQLEWSAGQRGKPGKLQINGELEGLPLSIAASLSGEDHREGKPHHYAVSLEGQLLGAKVEAGGVTGLNLRDIDLALDLQAPSLASLARWAAVEEVDLPNLGPVAAAATLQGVKGVLGLQDIDVRIGDREHAWLEAKGAAHNLEGARDVHLDLEFGTRDLRYLNPWLREPPLELDSFTGSAALTDKDGTLGLEALVLNAGREEILDISVEGHVDQLETVGEIDLQVKLHARYLADLGSLILTPFPLAGPLRFSGHITGGREGASVQGLALSLGESKVKGSLVYRHPSGKRPTVEAKLNSPQVRLKDLGVFPGARERAETEEVPEREPTDALPFDHLKLFDGELSLRVAQLVGREGFDAQQVHVEAGLQDGLLDLRRFAIGLKGGDFELRGRLDAAAVPPTLSLQGDGEGVRTGQLLAQFVQGDRLRGRGDVTLDLLTSGDSRRALIDAMNGSAVMFVSDGRIASEWANAMVKDVTRALFSSSWKLGDQAFECLATSLTAENGVIPDALLLLDAEDTRIVGRGSIDLRQQSLDLEFTPYPRDPGLLSLAARVRVRGSFSEPRISTDRLSVPVSAGTSLFRNAFRLSGASTLASLALPRGRRTSPCDDLREELNRAREGG